MGALLAAAGLVSTGWAQPAAEPHHVGTPVRYERYPLSCRLLHGAATSAPDGANPGDITQILVSNEQTQTALAGTEVDYAVRRKAQIALSGTREDPPRLYPHQWVAVGELSGGIGCAASVLVATPLIEGRANRP